MNDTGKNYQNTPPPGEWDALPSDAYDEIDVAAWVAEYRARLLHAVLPGRNKSRDKDTLRTLALMMEKAGSRVFVISRRELVTYSGCYAPTNWEAVRSLRRAGYIRVVGYAGMTEPGSGGARPYPQHAYVLMMDALPEQEEEVVPLPGMTMRRIVNGDFAHDAFAGHKGLKANRRQVWLWARENPGSTRADIARGTGISKATVGRAVEWLAENGLVDAGSLSDCGKVFVLDPEREKAALQEIARNNWLQGKTLNRLEHLDRPFDLIAEDRKRRRRENAASVADGDEELVIARGQE